VSGVWESGNTYEQAVIKTVAGLFRGNPKHLFAEFGGQLIYFDSESNTASADSHLTADEIKIAEESGKS
jgi:hypothetical protein